MLVGAAELRSGDQCPPQEKTVATATARRKVVLVNRVNGSKSKSQKSLKRAMKVDDVNFVDASKEGNVSRFINVRDRNTSSADEKQQTETLFYRKHSLKFELLSVRLFSFTPS